MPLSAATVAASGAAVEVYFHSAAEMWQIFMGNVTVASLQAGTKVVMVHTTAGDAGGSAAFWQRREQGGLASVDAVLGAGAWTCVTQVVNTHSMRRCAKANAVVYYMRMPDGNYFNGLGYGNGSLSILRDNGTPTTTRDGATTYSSWADFTATVRALISLESQGQPASAVAVHTPDFDRTINPGDHPDDFATGDAVQAAVQGMGWTNFYYVDYETENKPVNLSQAEHDTKQRVFLTYDSVMVSGGYSSEATDPDIAQWLWRTYYRVSSPVPPNAPTALQAVAPYKARVDLQWTDNATTETGFWIERAPDAAGVPGTFVQIGSAGANATAYSDFSVQAATTYWYRVRAFNDGGASGYSNAVSVTTPASTPLPYRGDAYIVAHADDWQIFMGDRTATSFQTTASMLFIYTTAGDAGNPPAFWQTRERGAMASVDAIIGAGAWNCTTRVIRTHPIYRCAKSNVVSYFMRMPDGNFSNGNGYGFGSLKILRDQGTPTDALDGSTTYTSWSDFYTTIGAIVDLELDGQGGPYVKVHAQEYDKVRDPNDHPDHNATGDAVRATAAAGHTWDLSYYIGYDTENRPINITDAQHTQKVAEWTAYENTMAGSGFESHLSDPEYQAWVWRTYFRTVQGTSPTLNAPSGLTAQPVSSTEIDLTWVDNSPDESGFTIERAPDNNGVAGTYAVIGTVGANVTSFANTGLAAGTRYWYRAQAFNGTGSSAYSNAVAATTLPPPPPAAPSNLTLSTPSYSQINLAWTDNSSNETGFRIERAPDAGGVPGTYTEIATVAAGVTTYSNTGLAPSSTFWYRVRAYNTGGNSAYSNELSATTPIGKPNAPTGLAVTTTTSTAIALSWTDNAPDETGYLIERAPDIGGVAGTFAQIASIAANSTTYNNTGLVNSTTYWYRVRANGPTPSDYSNVVSGTTLPGVPAAPSNIVATPAAGHRIDVTWTDNSNTEASFTLQRAPDNNGVAGSYSTIATLGANVTSYSNLNVAANTKYWYRVRASNASGNSAWVVTNTTSVAEAPLAPSALAAKPTASALTATLTWTDNANDETGFRIERAPDAGGVPGTYVEIATVGVNVKTYTASGLTGATQYWFRVRSYSTYGTSAYTSDASVVTALPTSLTVTSSIVNGVITANLTWIAGTGANVDVYRGTTRIQRIANTGSTTDGNRVAGTTVVYKVCNQGFNTAAQCSNTVSITF